ncbi:HtaA domain-containing protein [Actinophytocola glycyrrhizae]|uniref:HtaA domain-containing protein n=1 Tax=Actinophytocola glycyrrhizae TaxID=2044873 RepID=A0ABV9SCY0_9PSEU
MTMRSRPIAGALVTALGALGILAGTAQAEAASVSGGHLDWGLKQSFRNYISGPIAHGTITASDGATKNADGTFRFSPAAGDVDADGDTAGLAFTGKVEFTGHDSGSGPLLYLTIEDVRVTFTGSGGTLVADVVSKSLASGELATYDDVEFATLAATDLAAGSDTVTATGVAATLTEAGAPAFADFYAPGTALDPLSFSVTTAPSPVWTPAVSVSRTTGLDPDGETITVTGSGFDPAANAGTRPPLAGQPTGVYLVFAKVADPWRPSEGAPSSARTVLDQKWVLPSASMAILDPSGTNPDYVELRPDGTFTGTLDVTDEDCTPETCGVLTYAAGGAVNAAHELFTALTFATTPTEPTEPTDPSEPSTPVDPGTGVTGARLEWGLKESFRNYISGPIAHGSWTLQGVTGNGPFVWEDLTTGTEEHVDFAGSVHFTGHDGLLDLTISQPRVRFANGAAELLLDVRSKGLENPGEYVELDDAVFATLTPGTPTVQNGLITYPAMPAVLTEQGASGFAGFYPAGTELDPVTVTIALDGATLPPAGSGGGGGGPVHTPTTPVAQNLADTGVNVSMLVAISLTMVLTGATLVLLRRRVRT